MTKSKFHFIDEECPCPECGHTEWLAIPDSLASACDGCGYVRVGGQGKYKKGATLQEWAKDLYEAGQKKGKDDG